MLTFLDNFFEIYFICHKIHPFEVYNSMILVTLASGATIFKK